MAATYDLTTDIGKIRLNTFGDDTDKPIFSDEELNVFLQQEKRVKLAAARVLNVVASRQALILKVISNLGLTTDGAKLAAEFRAQAAQLRNEDVAEQAEIAVADPSGFEIAEWGVDSAVQEEILDNSIRRGL